MESHSTVSDSNPHVKGVLISVLSNSRKRLRICRTLGFWDEAVRIVTVSSQLVLFPIVILRVSNLCRFSCLLWSVPLIIRLPSLVRSRPSSLPSLKQNSLPKFLLEPTPPKTVGSSLLRRKGVQTETYQSDVKSEEVFNDCSLNYRDSKENSDYRVLKVNIVLIVFTK